jgi:hypothetical protein
MQQFRIVLNPEEMADKNTTYPSSHRCQSSCRSSKVL